MSAGSVFHGSNNRNEIVLHRNDNAESAESALGIILQLLVFFRLHELTVGVQGIEHALERAINQVLILDVLAIHVIFADLLKEEPSKGESDELAKALAPPEANGHHGHEPAQRPLHSGSQSQY